MYGARYNFFQMHKNFHYNAVERGKKNTERHNAFLSPDSM